MQLTINDQVIEADDVQATETVLGYLRRSGFTGTKEGCASGDCGACTVMVGKPIGDKVTYHTINACIAPVSQYANHHIVTVEGLAQGKELHPVQQAMVDCHGSQCGFCTPGFVMSLAALTEKAAQGSSHHSNPMEAVKEAISGNLCRCTGYKPIVNAGLQALEHQIQQPLTPPQALPESQPLAKHFHQPRSLADLNAAINGNPGARLLTGGTDLMLEVTQLYREFSGLIDLSQIDELKVIQEQDDDIVIGAAVPYSTIESILGSQSPQLVKLLHRLGSKQIRNSGSIGGNLGNGSPIADMPPILLAWDATLQIGSADGSQRTLAVADFYHGYRQTDLADNEYIISTTITKSEMARFHRFYKNSKRIEDDISSVMGAFSFAFENDKVTDARVAYGGMAATPIRLPEVEALLTGKTIDSDLLLQVSELAAAQLNPMTDVRASADYRKAMAVQMLTRALRELNGEVILDITEAPLGVSS